MYEDKTLKKRKREAIAYNMHKEKPLGLCELFMCFVSRENGYLDTIFNMFPGK